MLTSDPYIYNIYSPSSPWATGNNRRSLGKFQFIHACNHYPLSTHYVAGTVLDPGGPCML